MPEVRCLCGEIATHTAYLPMPDIYAGIRPVTEPHPVCGYHAGKARSMGYLVEEGVTKRAAEGVGYEKPTLPGEPLPERLRPTRPFPKTYGDWVDLAEDIKERYPDDPVMRATANFSLSQILAEEERSPGWSPESAAEAKRWLTRKAGELGTGD